jgi:hypothetical protein
LDDETKALVIGIRDEIVKIYNLFEELNKRGSESLRLILSLRSDWSAKSPSREQVAAYREETKSATSLAESFSIWFEEHPAARQVFFENALAEYRDASTEEKIDFLQKFRDNQLVELENDLPRFKEIVDKLDASAETLKAIVAFDS